MRLSPLCETFLSLFALSNLKEAWIADFWEQSGEGGIWNFLFVRNLNDWELADMEWFLYLLQGQTLKREEEDRVLWKGDGKGFFSLRGL